MVGSGGVGKSALTLQFMYDEVGPYNKNDRKIRAVSEFSMHKHTSEKAKPLD